MEIVQPLAPPADLADVPSWQAACADRVVLATGPAQVELVAAADVAYAKDESLAYAAVVVVEIHTWRCVERRTWIGPPPYPYASGLFSLREAGCLIPALQALATQPDMLLIDGHGLAHPRRFGLASHLGVLFDAPTIGCAKRPLAGTLGPLETQRGAQAPIVVDGQCVGVALRTRDRTRPVYVSPGHRFDVASAAARILDLAPTFRIPEPLRQAHHHTVALRAGHPLS